MGALRLARLELVGTLPVPTVGGAVDSADAKAVVGGVAAGIAADGDAVPWLKRVLLNPLTAQLAGGTPFGCPRDGLVFLARSFQENRGVRIAEEELDDRAFDGDRLRRIGAGEGVVRPRVTRTQYGGGQQEDRECEFCPSRH